MRTNLFLACVSIFVLIGCCSTGYDRGCQTEVTPEPAPPGEARIIDQPEAPRVLVKESKPVPARRNVPETVRTPSRGPAYDHAADYSWLIGKLRRVHVTTGGTWKIRYRPLDKQDRWGGSVILAEDARIDKFTDGDSVYVEGEIIVNRPSVYLAGPLYRISTIRRLTEKDRNGIWAKRLQRTTIRK